MVYPCKTSRLGSKGPSEMHKRIFHRSIAHDPVITARLSAIVSNQRAARDEGPVSTESLLSTVPVMQPMLRTATLRDAAGGIVATISCAAEVGRIVLGRGDGATIRVDDPAVSSVHAVIAWDAERCAHVIHDQGSTNGTFVNGRRVRGDTIVPNLAVIKLGGAKLRYCQNAPGLRQTVGRDAVTCSSGASTMGVS